jgi:periplasmic divalent cation tolerance protein
MTDVIQVTATTGNREEAQRIAAELVDHRLAACVQISGPITSFYRWEGKLETSQEWLLTIKTTEDRFDEVDQTIRKIHLYDVPEILATPVITGSEKYLTWVRKEASGSSGDADTSE